MPGSDGDKDEVTEGLARATYIWGQRAVGGTSSLRATVIRSPRDRKSRRERTGIASIQERSKSTSPETQDYGDKRLVTIRECLGLESASKLADRRERRMYESKIGWMTKNVIAD